MQSNNWIKGLAVALVVLTAVGCNRPPQAGLDQRGHENRYGVNTVEIAPNGKTDYQRVPRWDNKNIDVDGDGDAEHLSGRNNVNNPSVDLRSFAHPGGGTDLTQGVYPGTLTADRIADLAHSVDGVANARALIVGQTVVLGMNLERSFKPTREADLIQVVRQRILVQAPEFRRVHITTDRALTRQIQRISDEIRAGHSLSMFNDDFMNLTNKIPAIGPSAAPAVR